MLLKFFYTKGDQNIMTDQKLLILILNNRKTESKFDFWKGCMIFDQHPSDIQWILALKFLKDVSVVQKYKLALASIEPALGL